MLPWVQLDTAKVPGSTGELRLLQRGTEMVIMLGRAELMNSRRGGSEEALGRLACAPIAGREPARVLIGGLGMGFTLRAALSVLRPDARVEVAELVPAVVAWARGPLSALLAGSLDDPRVTLQAGDVADLIRPARSAYDAIVLDVDNGPEGMTRGSNDGLYARSGLAAAHAALRPAGVLAVWSAAADAGFKRGLDATGFDVAEERVAAHGRRGPRHTIWLATRRDDLRRRTGHAARP